MAIWRKVEPDIRIPDILDLIEKMSTAAIPYRWKMAGNIIRIIAKAYSEPTIQFSSACKDEISNHLASSKLEMGGVLLGNTYSLPGTVSHMYKYLTFITDCLPSLKFKNSSVSVDMDTEIWDRSYRYFADGKQVIGWYHSHPNLGAFFSGTDRQTQRAGFYHAYSLGIVIDPIRAENKCFNGAEAEEIPFTFELMAEDMAALLSVTIT